MTVMTWDEVYAECDSNKEADGFCRVCCSCSGPCYGQASKEDLPLPEGVVAVRGGHYGSCYFLVKED